MDLQIFPPVSDIKPTTAIDDNTANFSALADPVLQNWDEGDFSAGGNPRENGRCPDRDICVIEFFTCGAVVRTYRGDAAVLQRHTGGQAGFAQGEGYVVTRAMMPLQQRVQVHVSQNVAAIDEEWLGTEQAFDVLDSPARFEKHGLMHQPNGPAIVASGVKKSVELPGKMMRVDHDSTDAGGD